MYNLPKSKKDLSISKVAQIFNNTSATYKFYWFISLLQISIVQKKNQKIEVRDILIKMICNAWYPINYFKLNFGFSDKLQKNIFDIQYKLKIPINTPLNKLFFILKNCDDNYINDLILHFNQQVPYRFLSPWISFRSNQDVINRAYNFENNSIYRILKEDKLFIEINPDWTDYLRRNHSILLDFAYWRLSLFVQSKNINIPNIANKLVKPIARESMNKQRAFWNIVFDEIDSIDCIYTNKILNKSKYDMEHFVPWSFVTHNQLWNLLPADGSINSSKSNKLPSLKYYLEPFVEIQREAIKVVFNKQPTNRMLEDFFFIETSVPRILDLSKKEIILRFRNTMEPLIQIASNSGFQYWNGK